MKLKEDYVVRFIMDEYLLMPAGYRGGLEGTVAINEVAAFILEQMEVDTTKEAVLEKILSTYEVEKSIAEGSLDALLTQLSDMGVVEL